MQGAKTPPTNGSGNGNAAIDVNLLLAVGASFRDVGKGDFIFQEGDYCRFYYQLVSGSVRWVNIDDRGKEYIQMFIEPGDCFGEFALFDGKPYAASAIASENAVIIRLKKETFHQLIRDDYAVHLRINQVMAERIRFKFLLLKTLANHSPACRIHDLLEFMKEAHKYIRTDSHQVMLTRQQIADLAGLRVETVIRVIRRMHDEGKLLVENRKIFYT